MSNTLIGLEIEENLLMKEISQWEHSNNDKDKGQIYTRPEVVDFMLTTIGLNNEDDFINARILEPSCGEGEFVLKIAERIINSKKIKPTAKELHGKILAVDLVNDSVEIAKRKMHDLLQQHQYTKPEINSLLADWFLTSDFLLEDIDKDFTHVIGNPPYVRVENIPKNLLSEYRRRFSTMTDRADLYIPFFEKCLTLLIAGGKLSFICTDRWTKNIYGRSLRDLISKNYSLELFIDLYGIDAFESSVMTYPAITQLVNKKCDDTVLIHETSLSSSEAHDILDAINGKKSQIQIRKGIVQGNKPWLLGTSDQVGLIKKIETQYPLLEDSGCQVFIGAATGANKIYIVDKNEVDIEDERLLKVITAAELKSGEINWKGKYLINTYDKNGVINLANHPKLQTYLNNNKDALSGRHVAKNNPQVWFKTIDRVYKERAYSPKLLIPDISNEPIVVFDDGQLHPNNSIYYICSNNWDLQALRVVLLSDITKIFISTYSTKIANGYLRFQSQHLRKLRLPAWSDVNKTLQLKMIEASITNNKSVFTSLTCEMYGLNEKERSMIGE